MKRLWLGLVLVITVMLVAGCDDSGDSAQVASVLKAARKE